jgi:hypothetical protein
MPNIFGARAQKFGLIITDAPCPMPPNPLAPKPFGLCRYAPNGDVLVSSFQDGVPPLGISLRPTALAIDPARGLTDVLLDGIALMIWDGGGPLSIINGMLAAQSLGTPGAFTLVTGSGTSFLGLRVLGATVAEAPGAVAGDLIAVQFNAQPDSGQGDTLETTIFPKNAVIMGGPGTVPIFNEILPSPGVADTYSVSDVFGYTEPPPLSPSPPVPPTVGSLYRAEAQVVEVEALVPTPLVTFIKAVVGDGDINEGDIVPGGGVQPRLRFVFRRNAPGVVPANAFRISVLWYFTRIR